MLVVTPWDKSLLKDIERAIQASDLGINPMNDGQSLRLIFPSLTEERRRELTREVAKKGEDAKFPSVTSDVRRTTTTKTWKKRKKYRKISVFQWDGNSKADRPIHRQNRRDDRAQNAELMEI